MSYLEFNRDEEEIYEILKEYLKKKKVHFIIKDLVNYICLRIKSNPNINRNSVILVLNELIKNKEIISGIKLLKENVLDSDRRKEIFDLIKKNPGINVNEIKNDLILGSHQALWHLHRLEEFEFIRALKYGNQKAFFDFKLELEYCKTFFYFRKDKVKQIIGLLESADSPLSPTSIAEKLNSNYATVKKYLEILIELKILSLANRDKIKSYILNHEYYKKTLKKLRRLKSE